MGKLLVFPGAAPYVPPPVREAMASEPCTTFLAFPPRDHPDFPRQDRKIEYHIPGCIGCAVYGHHGCTCESRRLTAVGYGLEMDDRIYDYDDD